MKKKTFLSIIVTVVAFSMLICTINPLVSDAKIVDTSYSRLLFDQSYVHEINVEISDEDWADLLAHPTSKTKYHVNVTIDGETYEDVSFATKGNTSLSSVAGSSSNRYGFKINFGKFVEDQKYHGLKKLNLSNMYADATYLKDYLSYEIFQAAGVNAPLTCFVQLSINGEVFGLYLGIEDISGSYLNRTQAGKGELYKPGSDDWGGDREWNDEDFEWDEGDSEGDSQGDSQWSEADGESQWSENNGEEADGESRTGESNWEEADGESRTGENDWEEADGESGGSEGGRGGFFGEASLIYIDDNPSSYSYIFNNAETNITEEDQTKLIAALKNLSEGNVEEALDTDEVIGYFVAHNFVMNYDSYTGTMLHNYYLYERGGKLSMLPWDYNLGFGSFSSMDTGNSGATVTINCGIDSPLSGTTEESRPMWGWIVNDEKYLEKYHKAFNKLISGYFESGEFEAEMNRIYEMIRPYVESDPSAFYTIEEFDKAYDTLLSFCLLRAQSIRLQLDGELSTITNDQDKASRVDGSSVNISLTGGMGNSGNAGGFGNWGDSDDRERSSGEEAEGWESAGDSDGNRESAENWESSGEGAENRESAGDSAENAESAAESAPEQDSPDESAAPITEN